MQYEKGEGLNPILKENLSKYDFFSLEDYTAFLFMKYRISKLMNSKVGYYIYDNDVQQLYVQCGNIGQTHVNFTMIKGLSGSYLAEFHDYGCWTWYSEREIGYQLTRLLNFNHYYFETDKIYGQLDKGYSTRVLFSDRLSVLLAFIDQYSISNFYTSPRFLEFLRKQARKERDILSYYQSVSLLSPHIAYKYKTPVPLNPVVYEIPGWDYSKAYHYIKEFLSNPVHVRIKHGMYVIEFEGRRLTDVVFAVTGKTIKVNGEDKFPVHYPIFFMW